MSQKTNAVAVRTIGIDTGKNTFHLIGLDEQGTIVLREKLARGRIGRRLANASPCLIGIEAGMATHYVARELLALGVVTRSICLSVNGFTYRGLVRRHRSSFPRAGAGLQGMS
jgi:hypothetical protein